MFQKEELINKSIEELVEIARSYNIEPESIASPEEAIERILAESDKESEPVKRTRKRVLKKDKTDHVYSVSGTEGENLDTKSTKRKTKASTDIFTEVPKKRGRKKKVVEPEEIEIPTEPVAVSAEEAIQATISEPTADIPSDISPEASADSQEASVISLENTSADVPETIENENNDITVADDSILPDQNMQLTEEVGEGSGGEKYSLEASDDTVSDENSASEIAEQEMSSENTANMIAKLQEKMNAQNSEMNQNASMQGYGIWEGDPCDGTDFIIVKDLPIEDSGAMMPVDIFDNPVNLNVIDKTEKETAQKPTYDFNKIVKAIGLVEVMVENYGFLRSSDYNYLSSPDDVYVPMQIIRKFGLKTGDMVECYVAPPANNDKYFTIVEILKINGRDPQEIRDRVPFEHLTPLFPNEKFNLCGNKKTTNLSTRIVDLFAPIGKGQRALIVAQPKTGKTILMKDIANAIASSHPEAYLMMLLIDERPEEVTDMMRTVNAEVIASTFDEPAERHVKIAGLVLEKAKRMVECGHDVVIFLDSITRLARAYNTVAPASGKVLTGGVDANALQKPKRFFGAARNIEDGGSLTIISTALIDTGSKMDEVIFEEFKGTGNMELQLDRALANKRIFPAVNLVQSSTRRDDLLQDKTTLDRMWIVRKYISDMNPIEAMSEMSNRFLRTRDNEEFILSING